ncbi:DDE_Tnp_1_7 domain-containing protein [Trichonephila clavipes]|nr:DDE_Tnp_1_7 domain-containing protein [Trichonephila clavipes]
MLRRIKNCTKEKVHRQLGKNEWRTTLDELDAFISILYARCIYDANNLELDSLWSVVWGPAFFRDITARDRFKEFMKILRFDQKNYKI